MDVGCPGSSPSMNDSRECFWCLRIRTFLCAIQHALGLQQGQPCGWSSCVPWRGKVPLLLACPVHACPLDQGHRHRCPWALTLAQPCGCPCELALACPSSACGTSHRFQSAAHAHCQHRPCGWELVHLHGQHQQARWHGWGSCCSACRAGCVCEACWHDA